MEQSDATSRRLSKMDGGKYPGESDASCALEPLVQLIKYLM